MAPFTFSATTRMFTPEAVAKPPVVNSPMTCLMPSACACSVVSDGWPTSTSGADRIRVASAVAASTLADDARTGLPDTGSTSASSKPRPAGPPGLGHSRDGLGYLQIATDHRRHRPNRRALDRHRALHPGYRDLLGDGGQGGRQSRLIDADGEREIAGSEERRQPGDRVGRALIGRGRGAGDVWRQTGVCWIQVDGFAVHVEGDRTAVPRQDLGVQRRDGLVGGQPADVDTGDSGASLDLSAGEKEFDEIDRGERQQAGADSDHPRSCAAES